MKELKLKVYSWIILSVAWNFTLHLLSPLSLPLHYHYCCCYCPVIIIVMFCRKNYWLNVSYKEL